jgi:hypothetical protein
LPGTTESPISNFRPPNDLGTSRFLWDW